MYSSPIFTLMTILSLFLMLAVLFMQVKEMMLYGIFFQ